ncbi:MAG: histidine phosphatase family protein [Ruminococcaceae bacterium]|nr:histidine phosphatase family protein [Oscillospiraceae bacterium]
MDMSVRIILVRHGESLANVAKFFAGHTNVDLSEKGYMQAEMTVDYVLSRYTVDKIYASDLLRAYNTVRPAADRLGIDVIPDRELREIFAGEWEGRSFTNLQKTYPADYAVWMNDIGHASPTGGESVAHLWERVSAALLRIAGENPGKTVLIGTHATPIRAMQCMLSGKTPAEMKDTPWVSNASVSVVEYVPDPGEKTIPRAVCFGEDGHLDALKTVFPANV